MAALTQRLVTSVENFNRGLRELPCVPIGLGSLEFLITLAIAALLALGLLAWAALVMPAQYFVHLIARAPAREALASPQRAWVKVTRGEIEVVKAPEVHGIPDGASESGISAKPVTLTASLAAIMLFVLSRLLT